MNKVNGIVPRRKDGVRRFTWRELSKLNLPHNAHVAYRGKVYDVSTFASKHPGGVDQILCAAGRDITQVFESYHNLEIVTKTLEKYYVGELVDNEFPVFPEMGLFYHTLRQRVKKYVKDNNLDPKVEFWTFINNFVITFIALSTWYLAVVLSSYSTPLSVLSASICGVFSSSFLLAVHHHANHCAITHKPWVWRTTQLLSECILGISSYVWKHEHNLGHHPYTNFDNDPDIPTSVKPPAVWRVKRSQQWKKFYTLQHFYMPIAYLLMVIGYKIADFMFIYKSKRSQIRMNPLPPVQWAMFWTGKIIHCLFRYVVPFYYVSFWNLVVINIVCDAVLSLAWGNMNMVSHLSTEVVLPPKPDENNEIKIDWAELQVMSTCDYCTESLWWFIISGGITHQLAHHLFPDMAQGHYFWVTPLVKETCAEFGLKYNHVSSMREAWVKHLDFLWNMGGGYGRSKKEE